MHVGHDGVCSDLDGRSIIGSWNQQLNDAIEPPLVRVADFDVRTNYIDTVLSKHVGTVDGQCQVPRAAGISLRRPAIRAGSDNQAG